jgi:hypothetical protein
MIAIAIAIAMKIIVITLKNFAINVHMNINTIDRYIQK